MMKKGFTLIELLIVVAIIAILAAIAVPNFLEAQVRSKVSRAKSDMRSYATGIESYYVDNNTYPVSARAGRDPGAGNINKYLPKASATIPNVSTFAARLTANSFATLTTPIAYVTSSFPDPFADSKGATFGYYSDTNGWILWSFGPNTDESVMGELQGSSNAVETVYNSMQSQPSTTLIAGANTAPPSAFTYDPTNGTVSGGEVWRVKQ